jgi:hypothetical protein
MEEIIEKLNEFTESYILGSAIESITFDNYDEKWIIKYGYNLKDDEFEYAKDMVEFLHADQNSD